MLYEVITERVHMLKFIKYVNERGGKAIVPAVDQPPAGYDNVLSVFEKVLEHEIYVSELINNIVGVCIQEKDFTTNNWIQWFVTEQIEEEASVRSVCDKLKLIGDHNLYMFDRDIMAMRNPVITSYSIHYTKLYESGRSPCRGP